VAEIAVLSSRLRRAPEIKHAWAGWDEGERRRDAIRILTSNPRQ